MDRLSSDLQSVSARVKSVESRVDTCGAELKSLATKHAELSATVSTQMSAVDERHKSYAEALRGNEAATSN
ncbi:hypothetical protein KPH14_012186, partial [Odynerus spinipes]